MKGQVFMGSTPLGNYLKMLREGKNLTQDDVAKVLEIGRGAYSHYENARTMPTLNNMRVLADFYSIPITRLVELSALSFEKMQQGSRDEYLEFLNDCSDLKPKEMAEWLSVDDRELVYYFHKLSARDQTILKDLARTMASN